MLVKTHEPGGNEGIEKTVTLVILAGRTTDFSTCLLFGWHSYVSKGFSLQIPPFLSNVTYFLIACIHSFIVNPHPRTFFPIDFSERMEGRGKDRKRNINARETHQIVAPRVKNLSLQSRYMPLTEFEPMTCQSAGQHSTTQQNGLGL